MRNIAPAHPCCRQHVLIKIIDSLAVLGTKDCHASKENRHVPLSRSHHWKQFRGLGRSRKKYKIAVARHTIEKVSDGYCVDAHVTDEQITTLAAAGCKLQQLEDADAQGKVRQSKVRAPKAAPLTTTALSVAAATAYLDVEQVEAALAAESAAPNDSFTQLIKLPHPTWEKRTCHALKIAKGSGAKRPGIYFLGGVHAREWGSPDILIHFVQLLSNACRTNTPITIGTRTFDAKDIRSVIETKDVFVFPQANPDGRNYSMTDFPQYF
ncbi:M14 family zinc carboxypeptidase [Paraburkholderia strydomiana]|uniref:M14 family zinc carboxypeptidase n=1 Tax=Paraburkholderia strydomiana TaxID=1245417 RepID=UPI0038B6F64D